MDYTKQKEKLKVLVEDRLTDIAVFMYKTHGITLEVFNEKMEGMTLLDKLLSIKNFSKSYPKVIKPILYKECLD